MDAGHVPEKDPRLSFFAWVQHVVQRGRELQERRRGGPAVLRRHVVNALRRGLLRQDSVCPARVHICTSMSSGPRSVLKATVNVVASFALPCSWACFTPRRPHPI